MLEMIVCFLLPLLLVAVLTLGCLWAFHCRETARRQEEYMELLHKLKAAERAAVDVSELRERLAQCEAWRAQLIKISKAHAIEIEEAVREKLRDHGAEHPMISIRERRQRNEKL